MIKLGNTGIGKLYLGSTEIAKAYLGSSLVHDSAGSEPVEYTSLDFVKFTGSQAILINYQPNINGKIEIDMQFEPNGFASGTATDVGNVWLGINGDTSGGGFSSNFGGGIEEFNHIFYWFQGGYVSNTWAGYYTNTNIFKRSTWVYTNNKVTFNGVETTTETMTTSRNGKLVIGGNGALTTYFNRHNLIIYGIKLYTNDVLLHEFVPKNNGTHNGLYDTVTGDFIYSKTGTELVGTAPTLPSGYIPIEYLESSGTQYINLGITPSDDLFQTDIIMTTANFSKNVGVVNVYGASGMRHYPICIYSGVGACNFIGSWSASKNASVSSSNASLSANTFYFVTSSIGGGKTQIAVNQKKGSVNYAEGYTDTNKLFLFARNNAGTAENFSSCSIKSLKIRKAGELVIDMIPVRVDQTGYMYDFVSGQLFGNNGTGSFTLGNDLT